MPRPAKFTEDQMMDAARTLLAQEGAGMVTIGAVAKLLGAPSGSIYHRFKSKDLLIARLWIRTIKRFQEGFLEALANEDPEQAALGAAQHVVQWTREHVADARVMLVHRRESLADSWPDELGDELASLNADVERAVQTLARRRFGQPSEADVQRTVFAIIDVPYAAGRRYLLAGKPPPPVADELVETTCRAVLGFDRGT